MKNVEIKLINSKLTHNIRSQVLWPHKELNDCIISEDNLQSTFHLGVFLKSDVVSIGTFIKEKNNTFNNIYDQYRLRAMATSKNHQGKSMGQMLINFAIKYLREKNIKILWCDARKVAITFYKKSGFKTHGEYYLIPKIGLHKLMYIYL